LSTPSPEARVLGRPRGGALRVGVACALAVAYAAPLFVPPATPALGVPTPPDAWLLTRIFPGVPAWWVGLRLAALVAAAVLLAWRPWPAPASEGRAAAVAGAPPTLRWIAVAIAALHLALAPFAAGLGPAGQVGYLAVLAVPALVLAWGEGLLRAPSATAWRAVLPTAAVIAVWIAGRLVTDLGSPRAADVVDGWRGFLDTARAFQERQNVLTELYDPKLPGVSGILFVLHGVPFFQAGLAAFSLPAVQVFQIVAVAVTAALVAQLAAVLIAPAVAAVAAAVFLFAPFTRFVTFFPGPFVAGPLYAVLVALAALLAVRRRSVAGVAALGAAGGLALGYPGVVPIAGVVGLWALWRIVRPGRDGGADLASLVPGVVAGLLSFAAIVVPGIPNVFTPSRMGSHFRWDGLIAVIDAGLLGQIPVAATPAAYEGVVQRPFDIVVSALLAPVADAPVAIRLWGDTLVDPVGAVLLAIGLVACVRAVRGSWLARVLLLTYGIVLAPAFVSPVDVANVAYAVVLPVTVALVAAAGWWVLAGPAGASSRGWLAAVLVAIVAGGSALFDVVNPRVLPASSFGTMFEVTDTTALDRVVVLGYGPGFVRPTKTLYTGPITAFAGRRPVGYFEYDAGPLPAAELAAERKDLVFWSHGYDRDVPIAAAICATWPDAMLFEIRDRAGLGRVHAARLGDVPWEPRAETGRWQARACRAGT
jgi:hypothetical protein